MKKITTVAITAAAIAFICFFLIWGVTWWRQQTQFQLGEEALRSGNYPAAISGYESSIHMYTPMSSTVDKAAERLWQIGNRLEQSGDRDRALIAYRSLRSSFYAVRGLASPGEGWIERCDARITVLLKQQ